MTLSIHDLRKYFGKPTKEYTYAETVLAVYLWSDLKKILLKEGEFDAIR